MKIKSVKITGFRAFEKEENSTFRRKFCPAPTCNLID